MNNRPPLCALAGMLALASFGLAQTQITSTTLSSAVTSTSKTVSVVSGTGISVRSLAQAQGGIGSSTSPANLTLLYVDREIMAVQWLPVTVAPPTTTAVTVLRGAQGTAPTQHASGAKVWVGPAGLFTSTDPSGACTRTLLQYVPVINVKTGIAWDCMGGRWGNFVGTPQVGTAIASQAGAMSGAYAIIAKTTHITGTNEITSFTVPAGLPDGGAFITIPDGAFTWTAAGNIVSTGTAIVGKSITWVYDAGTGKLYPSY